MMYFENEKAYFAVIFFVNIVKLTALQNSLIGCFKDGDDDDRVLKGPMDDLDPNGSEECKKFCQGFRYYGTESGEECFCGNEISYHERSSGCTKDCEGNPAEYCGGHWKIMIYDTWHCVTNPCKNEATCVDIDSEEYICNCTEGWEGDTCEQEKHDSSPYQTSLSTNPITARTSIHTDSLRTSYTNDSQTSTHIKKLSSDDVERSTFPLIYVILPILAVVVVASLIVILVVCKRRNRCRKTSNIDASDDVDTTTPYSTAYSITTNETKAENKNRLLPSPGNKNKGKAALKGDNCVNEIELEDYNVINLRSNNGTIVDNSYDHVGHFTPCSKDNNNSTYNELKVSRCTNQERNCSKAAVSNLYDQTDTEYAMHNERKDLPNGADEKEVDNGEENVYINDAEYSCVVKATNSGTKLNTKCMDRCQI